MGCFVSARRWISARRGHWLRPIVVSSAVKFAMLPAVTLAVALLLGLEGRALTTVLLFQALPTASSAYILARQLGGDAPLMAGITAAQTVLALVTLPLVMSLMALLVGIGL
ncbi:AEC family transporter [Ponticoccus litoralis]|uniref:AEC family transporter n=1 Tax=Ponticoccus litoralis TaxID=422297 RepID=A0AAW9S4U1_9RHOB